MTPEMILTMIVLIFAIILFIFEWVRVDVVGIIMMVMLPLIGLVSPKEAFVGLSSNAVCSIIAVIIIGAGLDKTGVMNKVAGPIIKLAGNSEKKVITLISGTVGIISKSGTLTYEAVKQVSDFGYGQSTCIGIGGDPIIGLKYIDLLEMFQFDAQTECVVLIGEIGGPQEVEAARWAKENMSKPVVGFVAGVSAPPGRRMGHAGAIISGESDTANAKMDMMEELGVHVVRNPALIGETAHRVFS